METDKIASAYRKTFDETQWNVETTLQSDEGNIQKVLVGTSKAYVDEVEMLNAEARYSGAVVFELLFVNDEGANHVLSETVSFNGKIQNDLINPLMKPVYNVEIIDTKVEKIGDDSVKMTATVGLKLDALQTDEIEVLKPNSENIQFNKEMITLNKVVSSGTSAFEIAEEYNTKSNVQKVLLKNAQLEIKNVEAGTGYFTVEGNMFLNTVLEVLEDDTKALKNFMETIPFKEEIEDEKIERGDEVVAFAFVKPDDLFVEIQAENDVDESTNKATSTLKVLAKVNVKYAAQRQYETEIATDAFSMTNKTNMISESFVCANKYASDMLDLTIDGQTVIGDDEPRIAKICAATNEHILVANSSVNGGELTIEGVAYATVVYLTDDDVPEYNSVDLEIPFSNRFDVSENINGNLFVVPCIKDIEAKAKKGKEINVSLDVCFLVYSYSTDNQIALKGMELGEAYPRREYALEMFVAPKGSTLWNVSKQMLASEDMIMKQNPDLTFPLDSAKTIVCFRKR